MGKPYQQLPILDCREPLVPIPLDAFAVELPHPYEKLGAPYGNKSPYFLRQGVLDRLCRAQRTLQSQCSGWRIQIFDAYRPIAVQQFMVNYAFAEIVKAQGVMIEEMSQAAQQELWQQVYQFWAVPSLDPATPPPHSTGAAIDITLVDEAGQLVNLGSPIDELSVRSYPDHFAASQDLQEQTYHQRRQLLGAVMAQAGFQRHPQEWWHFSWGDQLWAWLQRQAGKEAIACYGAVVF